MPGGSRNILVAYAADGTRQWIDVDHTGNGELAWGVTVNTVDHRVYVAGEQTDASGHLQFLTFVDSSAGTRQWTQVHACPTPGGAAAPAGIAADPEHAQIYVLWYQNTSDGSVAAETIAYQA